MHVILIQKHFHIVRLLLILPKSNEGMFFSLFCVFFGLYNFSFCYPLVSDEGQLRQMGMEKLLKTIPVLQTQIDTLLEFDCNANDLTNGVINAAFFLLFKDIIRLFACYNDGIITCLEKYFELTNKKMARETLDIYKKFLTRMNKVGEFLKVAEMAGIDRGEIPDLTKAPSSLLEAMEQHLAAMEGRKPG